MKYKELLKLAVERPGRPVTAEVATREEIGNAHPGSDLVFQVRSSKPKPTPAYQVRKKSPGRVPRNLLNSTIDEVKGQLKDTGPPTK